jgi:hypothetical protein
MVAAVCLLAGVSLAACAGPTTVHNTGVSYTCCSNSVVATTWHPGQQMPVVWTRTDTVPAGHGFEPVTLSAVLTGPYRDAAALKAAVTKGQLNRRAGPVTAAAPRMRISRTPPRSPVSIITIPADAPPGMYNLQTSESSGGGTVTGESIVSVG